MWSWNFFRCDDMVDEFQFNLSTSSPPNKLTSPINAAFICVAKSQKCLNICTTAPRFYPSNPELRLTEQSRHGCLKYGYEKDIIWAAGELTQILTRKGMKCGWTKVSCDTPALEVCGYSVGPHEKRVKGMFWHICPRTWWRLKQVLEDFGDKYPFTTVNKSPCIRTVVLQCGPPVGNSE